MKEITRIHIAGVPFNSELAAKRELEAYLAAIHTQPDVTDEVVSEIEGRMVELLAEHGTTLIIVTHDADLAAKCDYQVTIKDGRVEQSTIPERRNHGRHQVRH